jgi:hypothetical protein
MTRITTNRKFWLAVDFSAGRSRGADVNASNACWYRSVLAWAANNARLEAVRLLLARGARPDSLDAVHAAA